MQNYRNIQYLKSGTPVQQSAYQAITELGILEILEAYDPILVGTIPIAIDIPRSDLDIICQVYNFDEFCKLIHTHFGACTDYNLRKKSGQNGLILVVNFEFMGFVFEIYATSAQTESLNGYRHMIIESRIIDLLGDTFRKEVITLKLKGMKTEPAFAKLLHLIGDPYEALLSLEKKSDQEIKELYQYD